MPVSGRERFGDLATAEPLCSTVGGVRLSDELEVVA